MAANDYQNWDDPNAGDYGMPNTANGGATGIPDPNNPGYDTAGYPLPQEPLKPNPIVPTPNGNDNDNGNGKNTDNGGGGGGGGLVDPYTAPAPNYIAAPTFTPPTYTKAPAFSYGDFTPTQANDVLTEPGYQFGLDQGEQALTQNRAASGLLNTGSTLKDILAFGNNYATGQYNNVDQRRRADYTMNRDNAVQNYNTNYQTQYVDPYKASYQSALDVFAPQMADWSAHNNFDYNNWLQGYTMFRNRQLDTVNAATALS